MVFEVVHTIVASDFIFNELRGHLVGKFKFTDQDADDVIRLFKSQMEVVTPQSIAPPVCRDADDDQILGTALAGQAECIVTGDKDLLVLQQYQGVQIVNPSGFSDFETEDEDGGQP